MRSGNWIQETTTSVAGTSGNGAVTLTAVTGRPRFATMFGAGAVTIRYVIEDTVNKKFETGVGSVAGHVLTRVRPQVTWDGTTLDDTAPAPLALGSSPTSGAILVYVAPTAEGLMQALPGANLTVSGDATWRGFSLSNHYDWGNTGGGALLTVDRENYSVYRLDSGGVLDALQTEITGNVTSAGVKVALYDIGLDGFPDRKIVGFNIINAATTGVKTDTATSTWTTGGPIKLEPGWYALGCISGHAVSIRGSSGSTLNGRSPFGWSGGYGYANALYVGGSYAAGLPDKPSLSGATLLAPNNTFSCPWLALRVTP